MTCTARRLALLAFSLALPAALLAAAMPACASPDLALPWPDQASADAPAGQPMTFPSRSPFAFSDVGNGPDEEPPTQAQGTLYLPAGASPEAPVPAIVLLHGASGVMNARGPTYARQFAARGAAALVVDVFGARRERGSGFINRLLEITEAMFLADAYAALDFLAARPEIDAQRIALVGFSYGGMAATYAAYAQVAERYAPNGRRFAAHVAFYAPCIAEFEDHRGTGAPLLMLFGARDATVDAERCARVAAQLEAGGSEVETAVYEDAVHQWDGAFGREREIGRSLAPCSFVVARDGSVLDRNLLWLPMANGFLRKVMLALCAAEDGYLIGRNDEIRARSNRAMGEFLERALYPPDG
ncbi:MAG: dienelactone hydrolase family protein [Alphaproteobacteria bacterium]